MADLDQLKDHELADYYDSNRDLTEFEHGEVVARPHAVRPTPETRNVTMSVRFTPTELAELQARAEEAQVTLTGYIRAAALGAAEAPVDRAEVLDLLTEVRRKVEQGSRRTTDQVERSPA